MRYARLGTSGLQVSRICLGMMSYGDPAQRPWFLDEEAGRPIVRRAAEAGVTYFDTADMYSLGVSEEITGRLLRELLPRRSPSASRPCRGDQILALRRRMSMARTVM